MKNMRKLPELIIPILTYLDKVIETGELDKIKSLEINKRKPYTKRLFFYLGDERVCLHEFDPCDESDSFPHPHSWEAEVTVLEGSYNHCLAYAVPLDTDISEVFDMAAKKEKLVAGDSYHIDEPTTWHKVTPLEKTSTVMINGPLWENNSEFCKFTKGKELKEVSDEDKKEIIVKFIKLLENTYRSWGYIL